jgi:transposase
VTAEDRARRCPDCGKRALRSKGRRVTRPRDLPVGGRRPLLVWTKRTESVPAMPPRARLTTRLRASAGAVVADARRTVVQAARDHDPPSHRPLVRPASSNSSSAGSPTDWTARHPGAK